MGGCRPGLGSPLLSYVRLKSNVTQGYSFRHEHDYDLDPPKLGPDLFPVISHSCNPLPDATCITGPGRGQSSSVPSCSPALITKTGPVHRPGPTATLCSKDTVTAPPFVLGPSVRPIHLCSAANPQPLTFRPAPLPQTHLKYSSASAHPHPLRLLVTAGTH